MRVGWTITSHKHRKYFTKLTLNESHPVYCASYKAHPRALDFEIMEIDSMITVGVIELGKRRLAASVVFAPKKDGSLRCCVYYMKLTAITIRDWYPIPQIDECINSFFIALIISTLDVNCSDWKVEIDD